MNSSESVRMFTRPTVHKTWRSHVEDAASRGPIRMEELKYFMSGVSSRGDLAKNAVEV